MIKRKSARLYRAWINHPSNHTDLHKFHGKTCIAHDIGEASITVYFTEGPIHSMTVLRENVSQMKLSSAG